MSLVKTAMRICAVEAIKGNTAFGDNVLDSENDAFSTSSGADLQTPQSEPFIAVYTEGSNNPSPSAPMDLLDSGSVELAIEFGLAIKHCVKNEDGDSIIAVDLPATDATMDFELDLVSLQTKNALLNPNNEWSELFRGFTLSLSSAHTQRAGQSQISRLAAQQIKLVFSVISDPVVGQELGFDSPFALLLDKLETHADETYQGIAARMREFLSGSSNGCQSQITRGLSNAASVSLAGVADAPVPPLDSKQISGLTVSDGSGEQTVDFGDD